jgi:hypothetical protein
MGGFDDWTNFNKDMQGYTPNDDIAQRTADGENVSVEEVEADMREQRRAREQERQQQGAVEQQRGAAMCTQYTQDNGQRDEEEDSNDTDGGDVDEVNEGWSVDPEAKDVKQPSYGVEANGHDPNDTPTDQEEDAPTSGDEDNGVNNEDNGIPASDGQFEAQGSESNDNQGDSNASMFLLHLAGHYST